MSRKLKVTIVPNDSISDISKWCVDTAIDYVLKDPKTAVIIYDFNKSLDSYADQLKINDVTLISGSTPSRRFSSFISNCNIAHKSMIVFFIGYSPASDPLNHMLKMLTFEQIQHRDYHIYVSVDPADFNGKHHQQMKSIMDQHTNKEQPLQIAQPFMKDWNSKMRSDFEELYQKYWKFVYKYEVGYESHFKPDDPWYKRSEFYEELYETGMHIKVSQGY